MKSEDKLSATYQKVKAILLGGWSGTYGDLCAAVGRSRRAGRVIGRLVKGFALRHPDWDHSHVYAKATGLPAYQ